MEELHASPRTSVRGSFLRNRTLLLCMLPTLLLGATYMLLVEFVLRESIRIADVPPLLRYGGAGVVVLFLLVSLGCAFSLADGALRQLRALQRIANGTEVPEGPEGYDLQTRDPDLRRLFLRIHAIVQQNRAGAQAIAELEKLQREATEIRAALGRSAATGALSIPMVRVGDRHPADLAPEIDRLLSRLREEVQRLETGLVLLDERLAAERAPGPGGMESEIDRLERFGTIWSLEIELARRRSPQIRGELGSCFSEFSTALADLRKRLEDRSTGVETIAGVRTDVAKLRRIVAQWLEGDSGPGGAGQTSESPGGGTR